MQELCCTPRAAIDELFTLMQSNTLLVKYSYTRNKVHGEHNMHRMKNQIAAQWLVI
jgi:hypothetical protein